jgi:pimeloyl-ACP methyl ester carboxylesterase
LINPRAHSQAGRSTSPGQDQLGLHVVHRPQGTPRADVVFVHGLGGSSIKTWSKDRDIEYFWPMKFLPHEQDINTARIFTFGYNANFRPGSGKNRWSILDFAKDLLYDLKYAQDDETPSDSDLGMGKVRSLSKLSLFELTLPQRPIIFVVHSMGGLVVKEVPNLAAPASRSGIDVCDIGIHARHQ